MKEPLLVESIDHLIELCKKGVTDFFISFGILRSSKVISYKGRRFYVYNLVDDTEDVLTKEQLLDKGFTNIGEAIEKKSFWAE